uniref:histone-lysine N-methyltransferase NSD2 isoform X4 n=1 Tax=Ciona intestinalis TaxID=7719 RepID=UPI00089DC22A|nr:histone-lysine N-methyltransferase NSD2 isoform X4 [Ciona intestinalis]XP_026692898.1 histone-lysine N-methyltransferase NSD2 isoform X4 [Ciona intestinalis]|eukprot:XP_018670067.1 histone-lysine N-methyltransferase NSD2 isoform X4 [Ciona intestinalis]
MDVNNAGSSAHVSAATDEIAVKENAGDIICNGQVDSNGGVKDTTDTHTHSVKTILDASAPMDTDNGVKVTPNSDTHTGTVKHITDITVPMDTEETSDVLVPETTEAKKMGLSMVKIESIETEKVEEDANILRQVLDDIVDKIVNQSLPSLNGVSHSSDTKSPRISKRRRVPKKSHDDDSPKEVLKPSPALELKPKLPVVETPILWKSADLVWAYVAGHPLWPCMITTDPIENLFTKMRGSGRAIRMYHVQFLGDSPERGWVTEQRIFAYKSAEDYDVIIGDIINKQKKLTKKVPKSEIPIRLRPIWNSAIEEIAEAVPCSVEDRITNFKYDFKPYTKKLQKLPFKDEADSADSTKVSRQKVTVKRLQKGQSNKNQDDPLRGVKKSATTKLSKPVVATLLGHLNQSDVDACEGNKDPLFIAYCKKHKPAVSAQKPELTPEQIEALIWMEWEALSSEEQRKCSIIEREESSDDKSPKKKGRPLKKSSDTPDSTMFKCSSCPASYRSSHSLGQHKRWCAGIAAANKGSSVLNKNSKEVSSPMKNNGDISFSCDGCKESFFDKRSLKIHKKFCSASTQTDSAVQSPASKSSALLSRKKSIQQDDTSSNGSKADSEDAPGIKRLKSRGPQLGSNTKRENICSKCESASDEEELVHCIGGCCASFHPRCLEEGAITSIVSFTCKLCKEDNHPCFICKKSSSNDDSLGEIKRCSVPKCGRSYHTTCLTERKIALLQHDDDDQKKQDKEKEKERQAILNSSKCTLHQCGTCTTKEKEDSNVASSNRCKMFRCIRCPTAFHIGDDCIAAGSILLPGLNIICPDHFEPLKTTPHHQPVHVSWCFVCSKGGQLMCCETCPAAFHPLCVGFPQTPEGEWFCRDCRYKKRPLYGEIVWVKLGSYRWWPGEITHPNEIPDNIQRLHHGIGEFVVRFFGSNDYFWLNKRRVFAYQEGDTGATSTNCSRGISSVFNKALQEAQESFEELMSYRQKLQDVKTQKKRPMYKHIKTNKPVGGVQIYTAELSEIARCICKKTDPNPCGPESECLNRMLMYECHSDLCPAGEKCQNQRFQKREYPSSEVFKTSWGGWALRAKDLIKKGEFVSEYVGELVDSEECMRRIEDAHKNNVTNFYMLTIDKDRIIDAGPKGNYSRFMNHSCDPNCETQKWMVNGDTRVGLFALREIQDGEELMFNYNLDCLGNDKTPCMCGSANCSGFIGVRPKPQMGENGNNGKSVKRKRRRQESKNVPKHDDFCFRCRQVGTLVCCDVRACQRAFCLRCLRLTKSPFGKWQCPWHHCDFCGRRAQNFCHFCPNSFCSSHVANQLLPSVPNKYDCCTDHDPNVAEYEMEEAIAAICASMLGPDGSSEIHDEDLESPSSAPEQEVLPDPKNVQMPSPKKAPVAPVPTLGVSTPPPRKRGRPRKNKTIETPVPKIPEPVTQEETLLSDAITESDDPEEEDDDEYLGPPTSSPYKMKRVKRSFYTGRKKKRRKSNAESAQSKNAKSSPGKNAKSSPLKNLQTIPQNNVESSPQNNAVSPTLNNDSPVKMDMRE